jgi:NAD(P)-dependent dehydrogenase (short-subunit alcohol dehydrogenase family)
MDRLVGRRALVSGGAGGIGSAVSRRLAEEGAEVVIADLNQQAGEATARAIVDAGGAATFIRCNAAKDEDLEMVADVVARGGGLHALVNLTQYFAPSRAFDLVTLKDWELAERTGPRASFRLMQLCHPLLRAAGSGSVVNFTSGSALTGMKYTAAYSAAKGAIVALSKVAANEWATEGIRVNVVCPFALTEVQKAMIGGDQDGYTLTAAMAPMGRGADPETEVAPVIAFLVSDDSKFMTGTIVHVDGGLNELSPVDYSPMRGVLDDA